MTGTAAFTGIAREIRLTPAAAERIRREVGRARGNEVCFLAPLDERGAVGDPRVVARGNAGAVLATVRGAEPGGLVLHNHPSGALEPSSADLAVAAQLWEQGFGFAITDNTASGLYVVVEPPREVEEQPLDPDEIVAAFAPDGPLARHHPAYEHRPSQQTLAAQVAGLYNRGGVGLAEAGTGTGKSVAYLLPAIRWAVRNRERTVVSTHTINLQEQLVGKDLPLLRRVLDEPFRFALVKGRRNYISIRRARLALESSGSLFEDRQTKELEALGSWLETTADGSLSDLPFRPEPEVWDEVASETDVCLGARCPYFERCHYQNARRSASSADVLVVNHHLLFADLAVRRAQENFTAPAVLPAYRRLILDEAHNVEESATGHLGTRVSRRGLRRVLSRLERSGRGVLPGFLHTVMERADDLLGRATTELVAERLLPAVAEASKRADVLFERLEAVLNEAEEDVLRLDDAFGSHPAWSHGLGEAWEGLQQNLGDLQRGLRTLRERVQADERMREALEERLLELRGVQNRLDAAARGLAAALRPGETDVPMVRWMERQAGGADRPANLVLSTAPLELSGVLAETVFDPEKVRTVVMTSATLTTRGDFGFLRSRLGVREASVDELVHRSPFDYAEQVRLVLPTDLPTPRGGADARHDRITAGATAALAEITDGGLFVLFTSYRSLRAVAERLRTDGTAARWPLFVHGEAARGRLVERFTASGRGLLLGTSSFWEGVDVPGRPLRGLVIPKIPFMVPTEPITAARTEAIEAAGGSAFREYMLPHAALRLKQGFGRLIRARTDRGAVLLLDGRLLRKSYGRYLVESLPPAPLRAAPWAELRDELIAFFQQDA